MTEGVVKTLHRNLDIEGPEEGERTSERDCSAVG